LLGACWLDDTGRGEGAWPCHRYLNYPVELARKDLLNSGFLAGMPDPAVGPSLCDTSLGQFGGSHDECGEPLDVTRYSCEEFWDAGGREEACALIHRNDADTICAIRTY
jgi:hypothetical protein